MVLVRGRLGRRIQDRQRARTQGAFRDIDDKPLPELSSMMAEVDVPAGQRTILDYFLKSAAEVRKKAFRQ